MSKRRSAPAAILLGIAALAAGCHEARESSTQTRTTSRPAATTRRAERPAVVRPRPQTRPRILIGRIPDRLPTGRRVVALTFDAGGDNAGAAKILAALEGSGATGTFFLTGRWAQVYPQWARRIAARFPIGNHTYDHSDLTRLTPSAVVREIEMGSAAIARATGRPLAQIFRFPYGSSSPSALRAANELGYTAVGWTVDTLGWEGTSLGQSTESIVSHALAHLEPGAIILMHVGANPHDHSTLDADALPTIIADIRSRGYTLVTLPELLAKNGTAQQPYAVGLRVVRLVDATRTIHLRKGRVEPRTLVTYVRYPAGAAGPFPLVVFGHGFAVTPAVYSRLLRAWTSAGYVVAAPVFPLENAHAPGGPNEADLVNQPADVRFVISRLLAASADATDPLYGLIDPARIAVAGHSDGGETALAVAYAGSFRDTRVRAAVILSGAKLPGAGFTFALGSPPLLAAQGTADTINPPTLTHAFYDKASRPKFLLTLSGAAHLPPYTSEQPQLGIVERVTIAFLDHYLKRGSLQQLIAAGAVPGIAKLTAAP